MFVQLSPHAIPADISVSELYYVDFGALSLQFSFFWFFYDSQ